MVPPAHRQPAVDLREIKLFGVEVLGKPCLPFFVLLVSRVLENLQKIRVSSDPSTIFGRTGSSAVQADRRLVLLGLQDLFHR